MRHAWLRSPLTLLLAALALAGAWGVGSGAEPARARLGSVAATSVLAREGHEGARDFLHSAAVAGHLLARDEPLRLRPVPPGLRSASPLPFRRLPLSSDAPRVAAVRRARLGFAARLAAARDGTLSSCSTGLPPPLRA
ncbi:MAG: hypothetical protein JO040_08050 [Gemmatimonadetes bacterium]|nr:hypothetical protein [Gemmatimonadota bacterium]